MSHLLLSIVLEMIPALVPWPRALLQALHPLWGPLVVLMGEPDLSVAAQAIAVLGVAAKH